MLGEYGERPYRNEKEREDRKATSTDGNSVAAKPPRTDGGTGME